MDGFQSPDLEADADGRRRRRPRGGQGPVVVAAAIAEPVTLWVEAEQWHQQGLGADPIALIRHRDVPDAGPHGHAWPPRPQGHHARKATGAARSTTTGSAKRTPRAWSSRARGL